MAGSAQALEVAGALVAPGFSGDDVVYVGRRNDLPPLRVTSAVRFTSELRGAHLAPVRRAIERVVEVPALPLMLLASAAADCPLGTTRLTAPRLDGVGHQVRARVRFGTSPSPLSSAARIDRARGVHLRTAYVCAAGVPRDGYCLSIPRHQSHGVGTRCELRCRAHLHPVPATADRSDRGSSLARGGYTPGQPRRTRPLRKSAAGCDEPLYP
jgi:hypothetical protein